jgi:hypothetical protein
MRKILIFILICPLFISGQNSKKSFQELKSFIFTSEKESFNNTLKFQNISLEKKSVGLAALYSLVLPGMGELYADRYDIGQYFTIIDGALWITLAGFNIYGSQQRENYKSFSQSFAGVNINGKNDQFFADIGAYNSVEDFNNQKLLDRDFENLYNSKTHFWKWESNNRRIEYKNTWTSSENAFNNIKFVAGALVLNRLVSVINAIRLVSSYNKSLENEVSWNFSVGVKKLAITLPTSLMVNFHTNL